MQVYIVGFGPDLELSFCDLDIQAVNKISLIKQEVLMNLKLLYLFYFSILFAQQQWLMIMFHILVPESNLNSKRYYTLI